MTREEAINIVRNIYQTDAEKEALQALIPELAESDDEKIRKSLLEFLDNVWHMGKNADFDRFGKADCADWIFYIEKQKEPKSLNTSAASEWLRENVRLYMNNSKYNELHDCVEYDGSIDKERLINDFEDAMQKEQKPAEKLSKEEYVKKFKALCKAYEIKLPNREYDIYGLCEDLHKLFGDIQKPEEWSKEDERIMDNCIEYIKASCLDANDLNECIDWFKHFRTKPRWKPSKKQMKALNAVANEGVLLDLFNDLLKLL